MKKRSKLRKGLAILLSLAMVVGLVPGVGTMKVSAEESSATEETGTAAGITYTPLDGNPEGNYSEQWGDERYSMLLDGTADTKWCCSFTNPSYVIFKTSKPIYVKGYSIWTANDSSQESGARNPVAWTLSGCNDYDETNKTGGNWVTIHEVKGDNDEEALPAADKTEQSYSFAESEYSYQYFKLNITAIKDGSTMQLGDFSLTYNACEHQWVATGETIEPTCTEGGYEVYQCSLCQATKKEANSNPATGHRWEITETVAPTCTEEGYTHQECSACKEEQNIEIKSALGHELNENGVCTRCGISVPYLSCNSDGKNWTTSTCPSAFLVKADDTKWGTSDTESWYVASGTVTIDSRVTVNGTVHLILADNCNLTINGGIGVTQGNNFTIYAQSDGNEMGHLTIQNVSGKDAGIGGTSSISGKITINGGIVSSATQATYNGGAAIGGGKAYYGDVTINGGKVTASGYLGAGIGHGSQASGGSGGVVINGGKVTASSYIGAGIGGGYGGNAKVTIKGGVITATSSQRYGIGSGMSNPSSKVTITDSPVIFASSISDQSGKENNTWSGIIFEGNTGKVYGTSATVDEDCTIPGGKILEVAKEQTISIADNKTLTNEGIIYNNGTFTGAVTNSGTIHNTGTISGELGGTVYHYTVEPAENSNCQSVGLALKAADTAFEGTVTYALADSVTNVVIENESTLKVTNRDEIKDTIPVTATFTVNNVTMTKTGNISIPDHNFPAEFDDGFKLCSVCGKVIYQSAEVISDTHYPELIGNYVGYYAIENAGQLYWFAGLVNGTLDGVTQNKAENAVLTADIDLSGIDNWTPIGNETNQYTGTFDGQNHTIKDMSITEQGNNSGLFGYTANAAIKNIIISGKITITAASYTEGYGSIVGRMDNSTIFNCHSSVNITIDSTMESTEGNCIGHIGGIVGKMHEANSAIANCSYSGTIELNDSPVNVAAGIAGYAINSAVPITNCSFTGTINSTYSGQTIIGGIFGYTRSAGDVKVTNCLSVGTITKSGDTSLTGILIGQINNGYGNNAVKNNYYSSSSSLNVFGSTSGTPTTAPATSCTTEKLESGEVAFLLQGEQQEAVWGQKLGENGDTYPVLKKAGDEGNTVYRNETYNGCEGNKGEPVYSYSNTQKAPVYAEHTIGEDGICSICNQKIKYKVSLTSTVDGTDAEDTVALLTGGGLYTIGTEATVTAPEKEGFTFKGWYNSGYGENDELRSKKLSYTFTPEADTSLVAVYVANASITLNVNGDSNAYSVNGTTQTSSSFTQSFKAGSSITVAYTGSDSFCYWKNDSGNIVSRDREYTFTLVSDTSLTAVAVGNSAGSEESGYSTLIEFVSYYGQVMQATTWNSKDDASGKTLPAAPSKFGGTFKYWSLDGTNEATAATILAAINESTTRITVVPVYEEITTTYSITVKYPSDSNKDDVVYNNQKFGNTLTVTADPIEDKEFAYWSGDAEGSTKLSYSQSYFLLVSGNTTLYPIYSETVVEEQPVAVITNIFTSSADGKNKLSFEVTRSVPAKYELVEQGVIYSVADTYASDETAMVIGAGSVCKFVSSDTANNGVFIANMNVTGHEDSKLYVKGYVIVKNTETGNTETIYTDMAAKSYNDLAQN